MSRCCPWRVPWTPQLRNPGPVAGSHSLAPASAQTGLGPGVAPGPGAELGSLCSRCTNTWCPPARHAWARRLLRAARTGWDGTRAAPPHLSLAAFPGAPPGVAGDGEEEPPKTGRAPPPAGRRELLQVPRKWQEAQPWGASHGPTTPISHTSNTSCLCLEQGYFRRTKPEPCRGSLPALTHQGSESPPRS